MKLYGRIALLIAMGVSGMSLNAQETQKTDSITADSITAVLLDELTVETSRITGTPSGYRMLVAGSPLAKGKDSAMLLEFLPNITKEDGVLKINGNNVTEVTVDGRKLRDLSELGKIPAEFLETVEVRYMADVSQITESVGGSIAIRLKPAPDRGFYGTVTGTADATRVDNGLSGGDLYGSISGRSGKLSVYESVSGGMLRGTETYDMTTRYDGGTDFRSMRSRHNSDRIRNILYVGYDPSGGHSLSLSWTLFWRRSGGSEREQDAAYPGLRSHGRNLSSTLALAYSGRLGEKCGILSLSAEWLARNHRQCQDILDEGTVYSRTDYRNISDLFKLSARWSRTVARNHSLSAGVTYDMADLRTRQSDLSNARIPDTWQHVVTYTPLLYASAEGRFGVVAYSAGIGWQTSGIRLDSRDTYVRSSVNPSLQLSIPLDRTGKNSMSLMYRHVMENVPYDAISDKEVWLDAYTYSVGNPGLKAPYYDFASIMAQFLSGTLGVSASFASKTDNIEWQTFSDPRSPSVTFTKPVNIGEPRRAFSLGSEFSRTLFRCWTLKADARISWLSENAEFGGTRYDATRMRQYYSISNSFRFPYGWGGYVKGNLEPTFRDLDRTYHTVWLVQCRISKSFLNRDLYFWLDITPCGKRRRLDRMSADRKVSKAYTTPEQRVSLTIQYRFRGGKKDIKVRSAGASVGYEEISDSK